MTGRSARWTTRTLAAFWLPLALSWMMMIVAMPITAIAISRLADPAIHLAAYGVTFDLAFLLESPILMLLSASVALSRDAASFRALRRVTLGLAGVMTGGFILVAFTPIYDPLVRGLMGVPEPIAVEVRPALQLLVPWIGAIAWRRFLQGPLILAGQTRLVSYGTVIRLAALGAVLAAGVVWPVLPGAMLGALALSVSVVVEAVVTTFWALPVARRLPPGADDPLTIPGIMRFCAPLAVTDVLRTLARPAVTAGVARSALPQISLGAWPVASSLITLIGSGAMAFQEVAVAVIDDRASLRSVRRFIVSTGLAIGALAILIVTTPLIGAYLQVVVGLPEALRRPVVVGMQVMIPLPVLLAVRNLYRGLLIRQRFTAPIQLAMMASIVVLVGMLAAGVRAGWTGTLVASAATLVAQAAEVAVLGLFARRAAETLV